MKPAIAAIVIVAALAGAGAGFAFGSASIYNVTLSTTTIPRLVSTSTVVSDHNSTEVPSAIITSTTAIQPQEPYAVMFTQNGLKEMLSLNASKISRGGSILISIDASNPVNKTLVVNGGWNWPVRGLTWPTAPNCGTLSYPIGVAILQGHYSSLNVSSGSHVFYYYPRTTFCPDEGGGATFDFKPLSDSAVVEQGRYTLHIAASFAVNGTWTYDSSTTSQKFSPLSPGTYTVVEGDQWGDIMFLYFRAG